MNRKRKITAVVALALIFTFAIGGAMAWLKDETPSVTNNFKFDTKIVVDISEDGASQGDDDNLTKEYNDFVPGDILKKDPIVIVKANSENCWVFLKVTVENNKVPASEENQKDILQYDIVTDTNGWTKLDNASGIVDGETLYYREYEKVTDNDTQYHILKHKDTTQGNSDVGQVQINEALDEDDWAAINDDTTPIKPSLKFEAEVIQKSAGADASAAWGALHPTTTP